MMETISLKLLISVSIGLLSGTQCSYIGRRVTFPLSYIDHSINLTNSINSVNSQSSQKVLLPTGECEDMRDRDLILNLPGQGPRSLYPCFIESYRVSCLSIPDSFIEHVSMGSFDALPNLLYLDLSRNRIEFCDLLTFGGHDHLRTLVYDENDSQGQHGNLILAKSSYFPRLEHLYLRKNYLRDISLNLRQNMPSLTHLYLSDNQLEGKTFDYIELPYSLTHLHLERNLIQRLDSHALINLSFLFLDGNRIESISSYLFHGTNHLSLRGMSRLQFLSVPKNEIDYIERDSFEDARYLKSLNLAHNSIGNILSGTFDALQQLRDLSLSYNRLNTLPDLRNVRMLTSLSLDHNQIHRIPSRSFCELHQLKWLTLGGNRIRDIDTDSFINLPMLEELDLSDNQLSYLPRYWLSGTCLRHLDIRGNYFTNIESMSLENIFTLTHLYVQDNPLARMGTPGFWQLGHNVSVYLEHGSSVRRTPCYVRCDNGYRGYTIPRLTFGDEWTW